MDKFKKFMVFALDLTLRHSPVAADVMRLMCWLILTVSVVVVLIKFIVDPTSLICGLDWYTVRLCMVMSLPFLLLYKFYYEEDED